VAEEQREPTPEEKARAEAVEKRTATISEFIETLRFKLAEEEGEEPGFIFLSVGFTKPAPNGGESVDLTFRRHPEALDPNRAIGYNCLSFSIGVMATMQALPSPRDRNAVRKAIMTQLSPLIQMEQEIIAPGGGLAGRGGPAGPSNNRGGGGLIL